MLEPVAKMRFASLLYCILLKIQLRDKFAYSRRIIIDRSNGKYIHLEEVPDKETLFSDISNLDFLNKI